jgi:hypothetical protein
LELLVAELRWACATWLSFNGRSPVMT